MPEAQTVPKAENCNSCGIRLVEQGCTSFPCPDCGEEAIGRCPNCRDQGVHYECRSCGFVGP